MFDFILAWPVGIASETRLYQKPVTDFETDAITPEPFVPQPPKRHEPYHPPTEPDKAPERPSAHHALL